MAVHYASVSGMLSSAGISINQDFFTLNSSQVLELVEMAKIQRYYKPKMQMAVGRVITLQPCSVTTGKTITDYQKTGKFSRKFGD